MFLLICTILAIGAIVLTVMGFMFIGFLLEEILLPEDFLFYEHTPLCSALIPVLVVIPVITCTCLAISFTRERLLPTKKENDPIDPVSLMKRLGRWNIAVAAVWLIFTYVCFTSLTCVAPDKIVIFSPIAPDGKEYSYSQVEKIETGFGKKKLAILDHNKKGSFYYTITVGGKECVFHAPGANMDIERYEADTYLELEELDSALMALGIPKSSGSEGWEDCDFDTCYVERFLRIIENQPES